MPPFPVPPLSHWLRAAALSRPEGLALRADTAAWSYAALAQQVAARAAALGAAGLAPGDRVGIAAQRRAGTVIDILACVEAGVAYVPFDLGYPADRLQAMAADAGVRAMLGDDDALARLTAVLGPLPTLDAPAPSRPVSPGGEADLTYVLFTSGSTGRPKGVAMGAAPLAGLIAWHAAHPRLGRPAVTLQFAPLSFDVHFQEIFASLACGGTLVLLPDDERRDPQRLHAALVREGVERVFMPYVALQMLAQADSPALAAPPLRDIVSAGEQLQFTPAIQSMLARLPDVQVHNHYGPTETHVVTAHELSGPPAQWPVLPPIGRALPHVRVALRDPDTGRPLEADAAEGELLLGGDTLAHGYLGRPDLTAQRFLPQIDGLPGRWYATGDRVKRDADGTLQYLGRIDEQVKVDGFRIEPGEIEQVLMRHPSVRDAVVVAPELPGLGRQLVAHLVLRAPDGVPDVPALRAHLRAALPDYMVPARFLPIDRLPTTPSGKIDRKALPLPEAGAGAAAAPGAPADPRAAVRQAWQALLGLPALHDDANLFEQGARSLLVLRFVAQMQAQGLALSVADVYDRPTVAGQAARLAERGAGAPAAGARPAARGPAPTAGIAIVGFATRTAGAADVQAFWQSLLDGVEGLRHFAPHELDPSIPESVRSRPNFVPVRGVLDDVERFDAGFFGVPPREAVLLDPQQRLLLELCWTALEHAGIDPDRVPGRAVGVYAGTANNSYITALRREQPELIEGSGEFAAMLASEKDYVATRIAHRLNLHGPAVSVHTACSTGLVAVAQAWHALASGQCDLALAGGATVLVPQHGGHLHVEGGMESADGHCRPFDASATGTVFASGAGVVVLKRLEDAQRDGDTVYAVIRGVGVNNDGGDKASFTAPSAAGQAQAVRLALDHAGVSARDIGYVEAHGTATSLGDPIEVEALTRAFAADTADRQYCGLGSLKSNLGHTVAAAGVLGLIKTALALHHGELPATLHHRTPNPQIDFAGSPFQVLARRQPWPRGATPRRAGVSSFGVGGTNAHVVLEDAPALPATTAPADGRWVLPLSAATPTALKARASALADWLDAHPAVPLSAVAQTLVRGRRAMRHRTTVVAADTRAAAQALRGPWRASAAAGAPRLVFLFPGQGAQHPGMARGLAQALPAFGLALDDALAVAESLGVTGLRHALVDADPADPVAAAALADTARAQPALFCMSYALAAWLQALGLRPAAAIGHSIGEYAAATAAGVFTLRDALAVVVARANAMAAQPPGAMLAVPFGETTLPWPLPDGVEVCAANAPRLTVLGGPHDAIDALAARCEADGVQATRLKVSHAFHTAAMAGAMAPVRQAAAAVPRQAPQWPVYSSVSGAPLTADQVADPGYWARQVRETVRFSTAVRAEAAQPGTVFVEVGPGQALTALVRAHREGDAAPPVVVPLLGPAGRPGDAATQALTAIGALWALGADPAWPLPQGAPRATLPTYPFEGERHWFTVSARAAAPAAVVAPTTSVHSSPVVPMSRLPRIETELLQILGGVAGLSADEIQRDDSFVNQGLDSLSLTQATLELERVFGVKVRLRRLLEDLDSVTRLAGFLDAELPADRFAAPAPVATAAAMTATAALPVALPIAPLMVPAGASALQQVIQQQMQLMAQQLALLAGAPVAAVAAPPAPAPTAPTAPTAPATPDAPSAEAAQLARHELVERPFGAAARITLKPRPAATPAQAEWLCEFVGRYNARTGGSKAYSQQHRAVMADPRVVTGFNPLWKDLVYPIVVGKSKGARLWDVDGNEYIDLLSCFGANLLGYQPDDVAQAMVEQIHAGLEVGPQHPLAGEVAELIAGFTGMDRVAFCNTGSEAVMGAMRMARTVTGRNTIAIFTNSYHGIFDEVIVRGTRQLRSRPAAPGILANAVEHVLVLDWASDESLRILRERGPELAAIMTEPIQNKYPTVQPREFVQALRTIADDAGCALIFDEVVTGFRVAPGGAQEWYGVRADIATYGKIIGGGLPFAAIAGGKVWMDALDGGTWQYGDDSYPEAGVTYFAGTFVRHPLALAAAKATLLHLKRGGPALYRSLNERTQSLIDRLNRDFTLRGAPVRAVHCASLWRLQWDDGVQNISLFYYLARFHGLHLYEQFGHFVTEAMGEAELTTIHRVFIAALDELMGLGFIAPRDGGAPDPGGPDGGLPLPAPAATAAASAEAPLAPGQTERWLAGAFDTHARRALNESFCVSLRGEVDRDALRQALQDVLTRHDAFRVTFDAQQPLQRLAPAGPVPVAEVDLSHAPDADAALADFCRAAYDTAFDYDRAPLAAVSLLTLADGRTVVHLIASHLVLDGWASSVMNAELAQAYQARAAGRAPAWPPAESPLAFAAEESARFAGPQGAESLAHWRQVLANPPPPLVLGDRTPSGARQFAGDTLRAVFRDDDLAAVRGGARAAGATLFQWLLTAVTVVLAQRSGQSDFVVSVPYASQALKRHGPLMADGVLDLPLRLGARAGEPMRAVLQRVRGALMDALDFPLATQGTVARALGLRSRGDAPPFTAIYFNLNPKVDVSGWAPLQADMVEAPKRAILGELFFNFYEQDDAVTLDLHHSAEHFSPAAARALVDALAGACRAMAAGLDAPMPAAAPPVDARLRDWNATDRPLAEDARVEAWVAAQVARTPDAVAVVAGGESLTYADLDTRANRIAQVLRARGVGRGARVGLCLSRGAWLLPALLGVLKTGAAYVPLDPAFPTARLHDMAADAGLALAVTESQHAERCGLPRAMQLRVDDDAALIAAASSSTPALAAGTAPDDTAYVIYTSGSTGRPKGVVLPQRAVCNFLASMRREPGLAADDRLLAVTTLSFDIAVLELLLPLTVGARTVLATRDDAMDGAALARRIADERITVMQATPTTWHLLLDAGWQAPAGFRALVGGEALPAALAARLLAQGVVLWNMYGPTETTVWSTLARITDAAAPITIGRPIDNTQVWVLDDAGRACAPGAEGELCIGGLGVATGYHARPELTADRFVPDPFRPVPGARLYRTGDLARWRDDGTLEHLGRLDFQVKIRGYRIELGEIESRLEALPGVARSVVMAREDTPGDLRLVAWCVPQAGQALDAAALRDALRGGLPDYMLPQHVVLLDALPLLPNGKIDRKALPAPQGPAAGAAGGAVRGPAPATPVQKAVAQAMASVLQVPALGLHDDFFELGGHSLLAARLVGLINTRFDLQLGLRVLFEAPRVDQLSAAVEAAQGSRAPRRAPIERRSDDTTAPLTPMQLRMAHVEELRGAGVAYNAPSCHRLRGPLDLPAFERAFATLVQRQDSLRTTIERDARGEWVQRIHAQVPCTLRPLRDLSSLPHDEREAVLQHEIEALADQAFDLARAPLFIARLFKLADDEHAFFFMPHHIVWDGFSFDVLYTELDALYGAYAAGTAPALAAPALRYGDFAAWHRRWMDSDEIAGQLAFWQRHLGDEPIELHAATDRPRRRGAPGRGRSIELVLRPAQLDGLRDLARRTGSTLSIVLLSVYSAMLSRWLGTAAPVVGLPVRGRPEPALDAVMGFFNNMLPVRLAVAGERPAREWIRAVRQTVTEAFAHQDVPFELLAQRRPGPLYQAMFSFQDARSRPTHWGPLSHERIRVMHQGATEDLNLWVVELPGGIEAGLQYNADLYLAGTIEALRDRFVDLLDRLVAQPDQPLAALLAVTDREALRLRTLEAGPGDAPAVALPQRLAALAEAGPQRPAVAAAGGAWSRAQWLQRVQDCRQRLQAATRAPAPAGEPAGVMVAVDEPASRLAWWMAALADDRPVRLVAATQAAAVAATLPPAWLGVVHGELPPPGWPVGRVCLATGEPAHRPAAAEGPTADAPVAPGVVLDAAAVAAWCARFARVTALDERTEAHELAGLPATASALLAAAALVAGAEWVAAGARRAEGAPHRAAHRLLAGPAELLEAIAAMHDPAVPLTIVTDRQALTPALMQRLRSRCRTLVATQGACEPGLPLTATRLDDPADLALLGDPMWPGAVAVLDGDGAPCAPGHGGALAWRPPQAGGAAVVLDRHPLWRWRADGRLAGPAPVDAAVHDAPVEPATATEAALLPLWRGLLQGRPAGVTDDFFAVGGQSILAVRLMLEVERHFGRRLPLSTVLEATTVRAMAARLDGRDGSAVDAPVLIRAGSAPLPPLFLVHDGDGETLLYRGLAQHLDGRRPVYGLRPHAGGGLAMTHTRIAEMAAHHVAVIRRTCPDGPYLLGGLCAGGVIAFEVALQLQAQGADVALVAILDIGDVGAEVKRLRATSERLRRFAAVFRRQDDTPLLTHLAASVAGAARKVRGYLAYRAETAETTADTASRLRALRAHLDRGEPVPEALRDLSVRQIYMVARDEYRPAAPFRGDVWLFRATQGDGTEADRASAEMYVDPLFGWAPRVQGRVLAVDVPGGHSTMLQEPNVGELAAGLQQALSRQAAPAPERRGAQATGDSGAR